MMFFSCFYITDSNMGYQKMFLPFFDMLKDQRSDHNEGVRI